LLYLIIEMKLKLKMNFWKNLIMIS
jgi:hypothetical protein